MWFSCLMRFFLLLVLWVDVSSSWGMFQQEEGINSNEKRAVTLGERRYEASHKWIICSYTVAHAAHVWKNLPEGHTRKNIIAIFPADSLTPEDRCVLKQHIGQVRILRHYEAELYDAAAFLLRLYPQASLIAPAEYLLIYAARLRQDFGIPGQTLLSAQLFRNKLQMKEALRKHGIAVPEYACAENQDTLATFVREHGLPVVVKPTQASGERGVQILKTAEDFQRFQDENSLQSLMTTYGEMEVEKFIVGSIYHVDGILHEGIPRCIWPSQFLRPNTEVRYGNLGGSYLLEETDPLGDRLCDFVKKALNALQEESRHLLSSAFHVEVFYETQANRIVFCEAASRPAGWYLSDLWEKAFGINLGEEDIKSRMGQNNPRLQQPSLKKWIGRFRVPARAGRLTAIPATCSLDGIDYNPLHNVGDTIRQSYGCEESRELLAYGFIEAETREQLLERYEGLQQWFYGNTMQYIKDT